MKDFSHLSKDILKKSEEFRKNVYRRMRIVALVLVKNLVLLSPVDTGRLRASWFVSFDNPSDEVEEAPGGDNVQENSAKATQISLNRATEILSSDKIMGQVIWIVNNIHYLKYVNEGTARIAPRKFVETGIAISKSQLSKSNFKVEIK